MLKLKIRIASLLIETVYNIYSFKLSTLFVLHKTIKCSRLPVPDLPLCLGVLKYTAPLARDEGGDIFLPIFFFLRWVFAYVVQF